MSIDYRANLDKVRHYRVEWETPLSEITFDILFDKLSSLQNYRYHITEMLHDAIMERVSVYEISAASEVNYDNAYDNTLVTDEEIAVKAKSDKVRQAMAGVKTSDKRKDSFVKKMRLAEIDAYLKVLGAYIEDVDKKTFTVQQQIQLVGMDLKVHPDKIKLAE